jgi:hypothetical protein
VGWDRGRVIGGRGCLPDAGLESVTGPCGGDLIALPRADSARGREDSEPPGGALFLTGPAMGSAGTGADCFGARFFQAMSENRLGMRRRPAVGQHLF